MISKPETVVKTAIIPRQSIGTPGKYSTVDFDELVARKRNAQEQFTSEVKNEGYLVDAVRCDVCFVRDYVGLVKRPFTSAQLQFTFSVRKVKQLKPFDLDKALAGATVVRGKELQEEVLRLIYVPELTGLSKLLAIMKYTEGRTVLRSHKANGQSVYSPYDTNALFILE